MKRSASTSCAATRTGARGAAAPASARAPVTLHSLGYPLARVRRSTRTASRAGTTSKPARPTRRLTALQRAKRASRAAAYARPHKSLLAVLSTGGLHRRASAAGGRAVTRKHTAARAAKTRRAGERDWRLALTLAPSRVVHSVTGLPAGYGLFCACPFCTPRHAPVPRNLDETDAAYWERARAVCACPHSNRRGAAGWPHPVFEKGAFVGDYRGVQRGPAAQGEYVLLVDKSLLPRLEGGSFTIDGTRGSLLKYCNGVRSMNDEGCNVYVQAAPGHDAAFWPTGGWASVPMLAWRDIYCHDELLLSYGAHYFKHVPEASKYVIGA